jgi:hypothetical protein
MSPRDVSACLLVGLVIAGCADAPSAQRPAIDLAAINREVPESLRDRLRFAPTSWSDGRHRAEIAVPAGWIEDGDGSWHEPEAGRFDDGLSTMTVGYGCDGSCTRKDWPATVAVHVFGDRVGLERGVDVRDVGHRLATFVDRRGPTPVTHVVAAFWDLDAAWYYLCEAAVAGDDLPALPAFIQACRSLRPYW